MSLFVLPYGSYSHYLDRLRGLRINLNLCCGMVYSAEEGSSILDIEFIVIKFQDLVLVHIEVRVRFKVRLYCGINDGCSRVVKAAQRH